MEENQFEILMEDEEETVKRSQSQKEEDIIFENGHRLGTDGGHGLEGWVMKQRRYKKNWQARWCCVIRDSWWVWGETENGSLHGAVDLGSIIQIEAVGTLELRLQSRDKAFGLVVLRAETVKLRDAWLRALREGVTKRVHMLRQGRERLEKVRRRPSLFTSKSTAVSSCLDSLWPLLSHDDDVMIEGYAKKCAVDDFKGAKARTTRRAFARAKIQLSGGDDNWAPRYIVLRQSSQDRFIIGYARSKQDRLTDTYAGSFIVNADTLVKVERQPSSSIGGRRSSKHFLDIEKNLLEDDSAMVNHTNPLRSKDEEEHDTTPSSMVAIIDTAAAQIEASADLLGPARLAIETPGYGRLRLEFIDAAEASIWLSRLDQAVRTMRILRNRTASETASAFENKLKTPTLLLDDDDNDNQPPPPPPLPLANRDDLLIWQRGKVEAQVSVSEDPKNMRKARLRLLRCDVLATESTREGNYLLQVFEGIGESRLNIPLLGAALSTLDPELYLTDHGDDFVLVVKAIDHDALWLRFDRKAKRTDWLTTLQALIDAAQVRSEAQKAPIPVSCAESMRTANEPATIISSAGISPPPPPNAIPPPPPPIPPPPPPPPIEAPPPPPPIPGPPPPPPNEAQQQSNTDMKAKKEQPPVNNPPPQLFVEQLQPRLDRNPNTAKLTPPPFIAPPVSSLQQKKKKTHRGSNHQHHHHHKKHHTALNAIGAAAPPPPPPKL